MKSFPLYALAGTLVALFQMSCSFRDRPVPFHSLQWSAEGVPLPRYPRWSLKGRDMSKADRLPDPNSLYVFHYHKEQITGHPETLLDGYHFIRFWPDGRCLHRTFLMKDLPTRKDGDDFKGCLAGYYTVVGTRIEMEYYAAEDGGMYTKDAGTISDLGIAEDIVAGQKLKGITLFYERLYLPKNSMVRMPIW